MCRLPLLLFAVFHWYSGIAAGTVAGAAEKKPLVFGLLPYLSPNLLIRTWNPLLDHLEKKLHRKIVVKTAPDFKTFIARTRKQRYDLVLTAPHFAALAHSQRRYTIICSFSNTLYGDIVVAGTSSYSRIEDLRGKTLAVPDYLAIITLLGEKKFRQRGIITGVIGRIRYNRSHNNALVSVIEGKADVAVAVAGLAKKIERTSARPGLFRYIGRTESSPHIMFMASNTLSADQKKQIARALISLNSSADGRRFLARLGWGEIRHPDADDIEYIARFLPLLKQRLRR